MENIRLNICIVFVNLILLTSISIPSFAQNIESSEIGYKTLNNAQNAVEMSERQIEFAGCNWYVKSGENLGPGPNHWSDSEQSVWVDLSGGLHLKIREVNGTWYCAEVYTKEIAIYGIYQFFVISRLDNLDKNVVAALFLYKDDQHEIDIEFAKWGWENPNNTWYVIQPSLETGNIDGFQMTLNGTYTTHSIDWHRSYIRFKSIHGHYQEPPYPPYLIREWLYTGNYIPYEEDSLRIHINLWLYQGKPPSDSQEVEIIIKGAKLAAPVQIDAKSLIPQIFELSQNYPNPFNSITTFDFQIPKLSNIIIKVYDILGQEVKTLVDEKLEPNFYSVTWDGSDNMNMKVASGIYFCYMDATEFILVKKAFFLK